MPMRQPSPAPSAGLSTSAALELHSVVKEYPGEPPVRALDDVSLRIDHGELVAVIGPSGSAKVLELMMATACFNAKI